MNAAAWGVIGAIVGALASIATTWLTNRHAALLHRQQITDERMERHRDFQREILLTLQDAMHEYMRMVSSVYFEDLQAHVEGCEWGQLPISNEVSEGHMLTARRVVILIERVANDELRDNLKAAHKLLSEVAMMRDKDKAEKKLGDATSRAMFVLEELGVELRRQYEHL